MQMSAGELGSQLDSEDGGGAVFDLSMLHRLASSFPCLVELSIGQNKLLTDSCLSSVARWEILPNKIIKMEVWVMWEAYLWIPTSLTFRSLNHLVSIDVNGCPKWVWNISTIYLMLGSPQDDRQRYLYCGEALQEAEDGECYKLYLHKEDDKLPQNQKRAQVAFSDSWN